MRDIWIFFLPILIEFDGSGAQGKFVLRKLSDLNEGFEYSKMCVSMKQKAVRGTEKCCSGTTHWLGEKIGAEV